MESTELDKLINVLISKTKNKQAKWREFSSQDVIGYTEDFVLQLSSGKLNLFKDENDNVVLLIYNSDERLIEEIRPDPNSELFSWLVELLAEVKSAILNKDETINNIIKEISDSKIVGDADEIPF